jgi:ABC-type uncharacterized transport system substrate-binding protein
MKRREFILLLGGAAAAWPVAARAQQPDRMRRIGVLTPLAEGDPEGQLRTSAFLKALQQLGWTDGSSLRIDYRRTLGDAERTRRYAAELVALAPDVILAIGANVAALLQATRSVPIVFVAVPDPVGAGFVESLARPGGNATGFTTFEYSIGAKWLELLKDIAPDVKRAAVIRNTEEAAGTAQFAAVQAVAPALGVEVSPIGMRDMPEIERATMAFAGAKGRSDRDGERIRGCSSRVDYRACGPAPTTRDLPSTLIQHRRRSDLLRA